MSMANGNVVSHFSRRDDVHYMSDDKMNSVQFSLEQRLTETASLCSRCKQCMLHVSCGTNIIRLRVLLGAVLSVVCIVTSWDAVLDWPKSFHLVVRLAFLSCRYFLAGEGYCLAMCRP